MINERGVKRQRRDEREAVEDRKRKGNEAKRNRMLCLEASRCVARIAREHNAF